MAKRAVETYTWMRLTTILVINQLNAQMLVL